MTTIVDNNGNIHKVLTMEEIDSIKDEIKTYAKNYSSSREHGLMGTLIWSSFMTLSVDVLNIIDKHLQEVEE